MNTIKKTKKKISVELVIVSILVLSFMFVVLFGSEFTGFTILGEGAEAKIIVVNKTFDENTIYELSLEDVLSLKVSGSIKGNATIFANTSEGLVVVYDFKKHSDSLIDEPIKVSPITARVTSSTDTKRTESAGEELGEERIEERVEEEVIEKVKDEDDKNLDVKKEVKEVEDDVEIEEKPEEKIDDHEDLVEDDEIKIDEDIDEAEDEKEDVDEVDEELEDDVNEDVDEELDDVDEDVEEELVDDVDEELEEDVEFVDDIEEDFIVFEELVFKDFCENSCSLRSVNISSLIIEVEGGELFIKELVVVSEKKDKFFGQVKDFENITLNLNGSVSLNVSEYFVGVDLIFDVTSSEGYSSNFVYEDILITGTKKGNWSARIYALEGSELIMSNEFLVTVLDNLSIEVVVENMTENMTENITDDFFEEELLDLVVVGEPVKWRVKIPLSNETSKEAKIHRTATSLNVSKIINESVKEVSFENIEVVKDGVDIHRLLFENKEKELERLTRLEQKIRPKDKERTNEIKQVLQRSVDEIKDAKGSDLLLTQATREAEEELHEYIVGEDFGDEVDLLIKNIEGGAEYLLLEYETEPPLLVVDEETSSKKKFTITSETHYENIFVKIDLPRSARKTAVHLHHLVDGERVRIDGVDYVDVSGDGLVDRISWVIPHLSNQTFELELVILNPVEYLFDGDDWIVLFNTTGSGNFTIFSDNAGWENIPEHEESVVAEMKFIEWLCGDNNIEDDLKVLGLDDEVYNYADLMQENFNVKPKKFFVENYYCDNETSSFKNYMNIAGYAELIFVFENEEFSVSDVAVDPFFFVTEWDTSKSGSSNDDQISLPLVEGGTYDFLVDWGDGNSSDVTSWDAEEKTHTYSEPGVYEVSISGTIKGWSFNAAGDAEKLLKIKSWGPLNLGNTEGYFYGASNLEITASDVLNLEGTTSLRRAFRGAESLTTIPSINDWDVSNITNMAEMFRGASNFDEDLISWNTSSLSNLDGMFFGASSFDQDISSWNVSSVTTMQTMFAGVTLSLSNYDSILNGWSSQENVPSSIDFHAGNSYYTINGIDARSKLINDYSWTITDQGLIETPKIFFEEPTLTSNEFLQDYIIANVSAQSSETITDIIITIYNETQDLIHTNSSANNPFFDNASVGYGLFYLNATATNIVGGHNRTETRTILLLEEDFESPETILVWPENDTMKKGSKTITFTANVTDNVDLKNSTLHVWKDDGLLVGTNTTLVSGFEKQVNLTFTVQESGNYVWNFYTCDTSNNCAWAQNNRTFSHSAAKILLDRINPPEEENEISVDRTSWFSVTTNVTCMYDDCGDIEVSVQTPSNITFTTCGASGRLGPSQEDCEAEYSQNPYLQSVVVNEGIQEWVVPYTGTYKIEAYGAQGSPATATTGGLGAKMSGYFELEKGEVIQILVGQNAPNPSGRLYLSSSGGGGSFIVREPYNSNEAILLIAGGGGGTGNERPLTSNAGITTSGQTGSHGSGGTNGDGGTTGDAHSGPGGGFFTNYAGGSGGRAFVNGGLGGNIHSSWADQGGGFGGGGSITSGGNSRYAGGGGYSGGSGSSAVFGATTGLWGGGGGSYNSGANQDNVAGFNEGDGYVLIYSHDKGDSIPGEEEETTIFHTNVSNPRVVSLNEGESELVTWFVKSLADPETSYELFFFAEQSQYTTLYNFTSRWNVSTVTDEINPVVNLFSPENDSLIKKNVVNFKANLTDNHILANATFYLWHGNETLFNSTFIEINEESMNINVSQVINIGDYYWNVYACDVSSNCAWGDYNNTFTIAETAPVINLSEPTNESVLKGSKAYFEANVSDNYEVANATFYLWYENGTLVNTSFIEINDVSANINFLQELEADDYAWNVYSCDVLSNCGWAEHNYTFTQSPAKIVIDRIKPAEEQDNVNVQILDWFNVTTNITCMYADCGEIGVGLVKNYFDNNIAFKAEASVLGDTPITSGSLDYMFDGDLDNFVVTNSNPAMIQLEWNTERRINSTSLYIRSASMCSFNDYELYYFDEGYWEELAVCIDSSCKQLNDYAFFEFEPVETKKIKLKTYGLCHGISEWNVTAVDEYVPYGSGGVFYTNVSNPQSINLNEGDSEVVTWFVNATGDFNSSYDFFVYGEHSEFVYFNDRSTSWNVTISDFLVPEVNLISPINDSTTKGTSVTLLANATDNVEMSNATSYLWFSNGTFVSSDFIELNTSFANMNFSHEVIDDDYLWNVFICDVSNNCAWAEENFSFSNSPARIFLEQIYPITGTNNMYVSSHDWFNVTVNVTCKYDYCGEVNVSLDPEDTTYPFQDLYGIPNLGPYTWSHVMGYSFTPLEELHVQELCKYTGQDNDVFLYDSNFEVLVSKRISGGIGWFCEELEESVELIPDEDYYIVVLLEGSGGYRLDGLDLPDETENFRINYGLVSLGQDPLTADHLDIPGNIYGVPDVGLSDSVTKGGFLISMVEGDEPFYTNVSNPFTTYLVQDQSEVITWFVNATGEFGSVHEFFVFANHTSFSTLSNITEKWNVTIGDFEVPFVNLLSPHNDFVIKGSAFDFEASASDNVELANATFSFWFGNGTLFDEELVNISGSFANFSHVQELVVDDFYWNVYVCDISNNCVWAEENNSFNVSASKISLERLSPSSLSDDVYVTIQDWFNITVNVSCLNEDCGEIEVGAYFKDDFLVYNFTRCGYDEAWSGRFAVTQNQCDGGQGYRDTSLEGSVTVIEGVQQWVVPYTGYYRIETYGARGGDSSLNVGGLGGFATGEVFLEKGDVLKVYVGGEGDRHSSNPHLGGWNGGGGILTSAHSTWNNRPGTGGGASDVRLNGMSLEDRIIVAGGGGGAGSQSSGRPGGAGGGEEGETAPNNGGTGGTQTSGGNTGGVLGHGGNSTSSLYAPGGGGYYGGGRGVSAYMGGGGGSSYIEGLRNASTISGVNSGAGYITITALQPVYSAPNETHIPFYTNTENPVVIDLNESDYELITWLVNATGDYGAKHEFFVLANLVDFQYLSNDTFWNVTISDLLKPEIQIFNIENGTRSTGVDKINFSITDNYLLDSCWYTLDESVTNITFDCKETIIDAVGKRGVNVWTLYANDSTGNLASKTVNFTLDIATIDVDRLDPLGNPIVKYGGEFNITLNVSCNHKDCGDISVEYFYELPFQYNFTTCGMIEGKHGPNQLQCDIEYEGTHLDGEVNLIQGIQEWTVPRTGIYRIDTFGSEGFQDAYGSAGKGAKMSGDFYLEKGQTLRILVGQNAKSADSWGFTAGGGGGSFVVLVDEESSYKMFDETNVTPLIIAGGGASNYEYHGFSDGQITTKGGENYHEMTDYWDVAFPGDNGLGGTGSRGYSYGGAGFLGDGDHWTRSEDIRALSFLSGGIGGLDRATCEGGFGGGGGCTNSWHGTYGGGGGYSGGAGVYVGGSTRKGSAGGGGSFNVGENQDNVAGHNEGPGRVVITAIEGPVDEEENHFFTNEDNPINITLNEGEYEKVTLRLTAIPELLGDYYFFEHVYLSQDTAVFNKTSKFNVSVQDLTNPEANLIKPSNNSLHKGRAIDFLFNVSDDYSLDNATLHFWYQNGTLANTTFFEVSGTFSDVNTVISLDPDDYYWNVLLCDTSDNCVWSDNNRSFVQSPAKILLEQIHPPLGITDFLFDYQNMNNITINVTCLFDDCGEVNVSLRAPKPELNFTTCGSTGRFGPSQEDCGPEVNVVEGVQEWTVPYNGIYRIEALGAGGGSATSHDDYPGKGAKMEGFFELEEGTTLKILVGQKGGFGTHVGGGGGGAFVTLTDNTPLIIAGGGGGAYQNVDYAEAHAVTTPVAPLWADFGCTGTYSSGAGGLYGDGASSSWHSAGIGLAFVNGGVGGERQHSTSSGAGGFGGGSGGYSSTSSGAGGGYSGGGSGSDGLGGCAGRRTAGGASYNIGENQNNVAGVNEGDGFVSVTYVGPYSEEDLFAEYFEMDDDNPVTLLLNQDDSEIITWNINAMGTLGSKHEFFSIAQQTHFGYFYNLSDSWNVTISELSVQSNVEPNYHGGTVSFSENNLSGVCEATDYANDVVLSFQYRWYKNDVLNKSGVKEGSFNMNQEYIVHNLSNETTSLEENWTFSCKAKTLYQESSWSNYTVSIQEDFNMTINSVSITQSISETVGRPVVLGFCNASQKDDDNLGYRFKWYNDSTILIEGTLMKKGSVSAGSSHTCGIRASDSRVMCWGLGTNGQLGTGDTSSNAVPVLTSDDSAYLSVNARHHHTCGIRASDSRVLCWGYNWAGMLGTGDTNQQNSPTLTTDSSAYSSISVGTSHTCGIRASDGRVLCWGYNWAGMLGTGNTNQQNSPTLTTDSSAYLSISVGSDYTCGIRASDSRVLCWGSQWMGRLGNGQSNSGSITNPSLTTDDSPYLRVSAGGGHTCGIRLNDSRVLCWGNSGGWGRLGTGDTSSSSVPVLTSDESPYLSVSAGTSHTCGIRASDSRVLCWGSGWSGILGTGDTNPRTSPTLTTDSSAYSSINIGGNIACGVRANDSRVMCWGSGSNGALGTGDTDDRYVPTLTISKDKFGIEWLPYLDKQGTLFPIIPNFFSSLSSNYHDIGDEITLSCQVYDAFGESAWLNSSVHTITRESYDLFVDSYLEPEISSSVNNLIYDFSDLLGYCEVLNYYEDEISYHYKWYNHSVLQDSGIVSGHQAVPGFVNLNNLSSSLTSPGDNWTFSCKGESNYANSSWANSSLFITEYKSPLTTNSFIAPTRPRNSTVLQGYCAANTHETLNHMYQFKWESGEEVLTQGTFLRKGSVSAGSDHTCGIRASDGRVLCWGSGWSGRLGTGNTNQRNSPTLTTDSSAYLSVSAGSHHTCGIRASDSRVMCWGSGGNGQLGTGNNNQQNNPTLTTDSSAYLSVSAGSQYTCGIRANDSRVMCWGSGSNGALGTGDTDDRYVPTLIVDDSAYLSVSAGSSHTCGIRASDGRVLCWGSGWSGRLGTGNTDNQNSPTLTSDSSAYLSVSAGGAHTCGVRASDSRVMCWGSGSSGQLGTGNNNQQNNSILTSDSSAYLSVSAGGSYTCGVRASDSRVLCWGFGGSGRLGTGNTNNQNSPTLTVDDSPYLSISAGGSSCGIRASDDRVLCWGYNWAGMLGTGNTDNQNSPTLTTDSSSYSLIWTDSLDFGGTYFFNSYNILLVSTLAGSYTDVLDEVSFSCRVFDGVNVSDWVTSSSVLVRSNSAFVSVWNTSLGGVSGDNQVRLPLVSSGSYDFLVEWGDGSSSFISFWDQGEVVHTYDEPGVYEIMISGLVRGWSFNNGGDKDKLLEISSWGDLNLGNTGSYFYGATNLVVSASDVLDLSDTFNFFRAFRGASSLSGLPGASSWDVSIIINMREAFMNTPSFDEDLSSWNVGGVNNMNSMFRSSGFSGDLASWDVSGVSDMGSMFRTSNYNEPLNSWDVSNVLDMNSMFRASSFNQPLNSWDVGGVLDMSYMFSISHFNRDIISWDVSGVSDMVGMFEYSNFNQDIGSWNISSATDLRFMFRGVTLSLDNYDSLLMNWAGKQSNSGITFDGGNSKYSGQAIMSRNSTLIGSRGWIVSDGGLDVPVVSVLEPEDEAVFFVGDFVSSSVQANSLSAISNITISLFNDSGLVSSVTSSSNPFSFTFPDLPKDDYYLNASAYDIHGIIGYSSTVSISLNSLPFDPVVSINSTNGLNWSDQDLNCFATINDPDDDFLNVSVKWYRNGSLFDEREHDDNFDSGSFFKSVLDFEETSRGDVWSCGMRLFDGFNYSSWVNSSELEVLNTPPSKVELLYPDDEDHYFIDRSPEFSWTDSYEEGGNEISYQFQINTENNFDSSWKDISGIEVSNYQWVDDYLDFATYYWRVRAFDGFDYGDWSDVSSFSVVTFLNVSFTNPNVDLGLVYPGHNASTEDDDPLPFTFFNYGNVEADLVDVGASDSLFEVAGLGLDFWQVRVRSGSNFDAGSSVVDWVNVSESVGGLVKGFDRSSEVFVDTRITVPFFEPPGETSANITFMWEVSSQNFADPLIASHGDIIFWEGLVYGVIEKNDLLWLDRHLGAKRVPLTTIDSQGYGDLYQWGRLKDGHEDRSSGTTELLSFDDDVPNHGDFINGSTDWRVPGNDDLWQGVSGTNNPCPPSWRLPTKEEMETEINTWSSENSTSAFESILKWPVGGLRLTSGNLNNVGVTGPVWTSSTNEQYAYHLALTETSAFLRDVGNRAHGFSVRCVKSIT